MRTYFIRYRAIIGDGVGMPQRMGEGCQGIERPDAIRSMADINQMSLDVAGILRNAQHLPITCPVQVDILSWQPFEDALIALPS